MKQLTINRARALGKDMNAKGIVILAFGDDGEFQAASYGRTKRDCGLLGKWLDRIYEAIESGEISDPFAEQQPEKRLTGTGESERVSSEVPFGMSDGEMREAQRRLAEERPNDGRSGRCGIRISGDKWCTLDHGHEGNHV